MSISYSLLASMMHELSICQHLYTKISPENAEWRPQENMRTTTELLQYLGMIGGTTISHFVNPSEDRASAMANLLKTFDTASKAVTFKNFSEKIDEQKSLITGLLEGVTDSDLADRKTYFPWSGRDASLFDGLNQTTKFLAAYRHQLFLYAKLQGVNVNTQNNWAGMDAPAAVKEQLQEEAA